MKPSDRQFGNADFLSGSFVSIPYQWLSRYAQLGLSAQEFVFLLQILAANQVKQSDFLTPQDLADLCGVSARTASEVVGALVSRGFLAIGERLDDSGTRSNYFDLRPLWQRLRGQDPDHSGAREWRKNPVALFEEEFGRPLSPFEYEQLRHWLEEERYPEWMLAEALKEAVLANIYNFKYIDRILFTWQRHNVRTRQELEQYRQSYRERVKAREETAAAQSTRKRTTGRKGAESVQANRDERYAAFYELFPDA